MLAPGFNRWGQVLLHFGTSPFEDSVAAPTAGSETHPGRPEVRSGSRHTARPFDLDREA
jgi:hypothetical protein